MALSLLVVTPGLLIWLGILLLPSRPWATAERLDSGTDEPVDLSDITVIIPARNEAGHIHQTLRALTLQGIALSVILVDDQSTDATAERARQTHLDRLTIISGAALPPGWSGKLWALQQGLDKVTSDYVLLLDADIILAPRLLATLFAKMRRERLQMVSLMARLQMHHPWEKILLPAFIFFFKLLYPFRRSNDPNSATAAAAGGVILVEKRILEQINAFESIKGALIDDCTLAKTIKANGHRLWTGLTHSATSIREQPRLGAIWRMVARTAYNQLRYSIPLLLLSTLVMIAGFIMPCIGLLSGDTFAPSLITLALMMAAYTPTLRYYRLSPAYCCSFPLAGLLFLSMTWTSACQHYFGPGVNWKERRY